MYKFELDVDMEVFLTDAKDVLYEHWKELALNQDKVKLNPDANKYKQLQALKLLRNIVVYKDKEVVAYSVILVQPHLHYSSNVYATVDVIYVKQEHRSSSVGARLLVATEQVAKDSGATIITHHAKPYVPMIIKPLEKLGYVLYEHIYGKYLGE